MLWEQGANVNEQTAKGSTLLHGAAHLADVSLTHLLLSYGANVYAKNKANITPLLLCFPEQKNSVKVARLLLDYGACNDSPTLDATMWDWDDKQNYQWLRPTYIVNWYYYYCKSQTGFQESRFLSLAVTALNYALLQYIPRNAVLPSLGNVTNMTEIIAVMASVIHDMILCSATTNMNDLFCVNRK
jgi:ankyrin repeat protein